MTARVHVRLAFAAFVPNETCTPCKEGDLLSAGKALAFTGDLCSSLQLVLQVIENNCNELLL